MTDTTTPAQPPGKGTPTFSIGDILRIIKDNFALVSAVVVLVSVAFATTVLASYLSVFDWHLIWFVQYVDILTFGLIAAGIIPGSALFLLPMAQGILLERQAEGSFKKGGLTFAAVVVIAMIALTVLGAVRKGDGYSHILSAATAIGSVIALFVFTARQIGEWKQPDVLRAVIILSMFFNSAIALGRWLGETVQETSDFNQDIYFKDQTLNDAKLVIVMSRHTALLKDKVLYVVPTGDIIKFRTVDNQTKPKSILKEQEYKPLSVPLAPDKVK